MAVYGTDINSEWDFQDGDLKLISDTENLAQSIKNRLSVMLDELDTYYYDYGSLLQTFLGWRKTDNTLKFIKIEVDSTLAKDSRITNFESNLEYDQEGHVRIDLSVDGNNLNFILSDEGIMEA